MKLRTNSRNIAVAQSDKIVVATTRAGIQASSLGCAMMGITSLKYTYLTTKQIKHIPDFLRLKHSLMTINNKLSLIYSFTIPSCWAPGAQILANVDSGFDDVIIDTSKNKTIDTIRKKHSRAISSGKMVNSYINDKERFFRKKLTKPVKLIPLPEDTFQYREPFKLTIQLPFGLSMTSIL
ncbi:MAG: hypothetical protein P0S95_06830 [Rhabdochlamydiaceae bacterium]|nr:hypothetical protein [Candidatus Amphrikana amoebophyrae]